MVSKRTQCSLGRVDLLHDRSERLNPNSVPAGTITIQIFGFVSKQRKAPVSSECLEDYRKFRLSSRPVPVPQNLAAWGLLDVL